MEYVCLFPCSLESITAPILSVINSIRTLPSYFFTIHWTVLLHLRLTAVFQEDSFLQVLPTKTLNVFLFRTLHTTCSPTLSLTTRISSEYKSWIMSHEYFDDQNCATNQTDCHPSFTNMAPDLLSLTFQTVKEPKLSSQQFHNLHSLPQVIYVGVQIS